MAADGSPCESVLEHRSAGSKVLFTMCTSTRCQCLERQSPMRLVSFSKSRVFKIRGLLLAITFSHPTFTNSITACLCLDGFEPILVLYDDQSLCPRGFLWQSHV